VHRWTGLNADYLAAERAASRPVHAFAAAIKAARPVLQSAMVGLGAYLVINGEGSPGIMIAASIVLSRALAPVETVIAHWRGFAAARAARAAIADSLGAGRPTAPRASSAAIAEPDGRAPVGDGARRRTPGPPRCRL
jgi:ABC-type protease/lipase transport system fused ATPase/permease subunit